MNQRDKPIVVEDPGSELFRGCWIGLVFGGLYIVSYILFFLTRLTGTRVIRFLDWVNKETKGLANLTFLLALGVWVILLIGLICGLPALYALGFFS